MPHNLDLILTLTGGLTAALVLGFLTARLRLSPIVGYLLAGIAVGPFTPGFVANAGLAEQMAELGVILLMFGVGLHFDLHDLFAVRKLAVPGAVVQILVATGLGVVVTQAAGWSLGAGIVYGLAISVASTVVLLRVLADHDALQTPAGHVAVGWLLVEDLFTVVALVMLPIVASSSSGPPSVLLESLGKAVLKIAVLVAFTLVVGRRVIPILLGYVAKTRSRELFTLTVLVVALGIAVGSAKLFGASMALGAFLAGMVVGQSDFSARAASEALPLRDAFAVLFFVSMGMLFDPATAFENVELTVATLAVVLLGKPVAALGVVLLLRGGVKTAVSVSVALAQIGEFSFMLAALGGQLGVLPREATQSLVVAALVSITLNPLLYRAVPWFVKVLSKGADPAAADTRLSEPDRGYRAVIVGFGPVGRSLAQLLASNDIRPSIVELNHETVKRLRREGLDATYGDASAPEVLARAGIRGARALVLSSSSSPSAAIKMARELNPGVFVIARVTYVAEMEALRVAGADVVVSAEGAVALAMTESLLLELGATAEQLDRARDRVREDALSRVVLDGCSPRRSKEGAAS